MGSLREEEGEGGVWSGSGVREKKIAGGKGRGRRRRILLCDLAHAGGGLAHEIEENYPRRDPGARVICAHRGVIGRS